MVSAKADKIRKLTIMTKLTKQIFISRMVSGGKEVENRGNIPHNRHRAGIRCRDNRQRKIKRYE